MELDITCRGIRATSEERIKRLKKILHSLATKIPVIALKRVEKRYPSLQYNMTVSVSNSTLNDSRHHDAKCNPKNSQRPTRKRCQKTFVHQDFLYAHPCKNFVCKICKKSYPFNSYLKRHMLIHDDISCDTKHNSENPQHLKCQKCHKTFTRRSYLDAHECRSFECEICKKSYPFNCYLKRHMLSHSTFRHSDAQCNSENSQRLKCKKCQKTFIRRDMFDAHKCRKFFCKICNMYFAFRYYLERHMSSHAYDSEKPHKCDICERYFKRRCDLTIHSIRAHQKEILCDICGRRFLKKNNMLNHKRVHNCESKHPVVANTCIRRDIEVHEGGRQSDREVHEGGRQSDQKVHEGGRQSDQKVHEGGRQSDQKVHEGGRQSDQKVHEGGRQSDQKVHEGGRQSDQKVHEGGRQSDQKVHEGGRQSDQKVHEGGRQSDQKVHEGGRQSDQEVHEGGRQSDQKVHEGGRQSDQKVHEGGRQSDQKIHEGGRQSDQKIHEGGRQSDQEVHEGGLNICEGDEQFFRKNCGYEEMYGESMEDEQKYEEGQVFENRLGQKESYQKDLNKFVEKETEPSSEQEDQIIENGLKDNEISVETFQPHQKIQTSFEDKFVKFINNNCKVNAEINSLFGETSKQETEFECKQNQLISHQHSEIDNIYLEQI